MMVELRIKFNSDDTSGCTITAVPAIPERLIAGYMLAATGSICRSFAPEAEKHIDAAMDEYDSQREEGGKNV